MPLVVEGVYENGVVKLLEKNVKISQHTKVFVLIPKKIKEEDIIKKLRKLKDVNYPKKKLEEAYYGRYSN